MSYIAERRKYQRSNNAVYKAEISTDSIRWSEIEVFDISAGGLKFSTKHPIGLNTPIDIKLSIYNFFSEFNMELQGIVVRSERDKSVNKHAVEFVHLDKYRRVQLDEVIKSRLGMDCFGENTAEDGIYTFLFMSRARPRKLTTVI
ncbi:MAG: PilZ domain-containing protein [Clostridiales bacterium]|jgi:hypothetical protein|nr:PilZ domain-containing protein [Eubacteriales bacterium]MDH7567798.1 PilZ domain-containing protein [Clostridiales bacterium]